MVKQNKIFSFKIKRQAKNVFPRDVERTVDKRDPEIYLSLRTKKNNSKTCVTSEYSDQPAHACSVIRDSVDRMCLLQPSSYPKRMKKKPFHTEWRLI